MSPALIAPRPLPGSLPALADLARQVRALPPLPDVLAEVLAALRRDQTPSHRCILLIERDQGLTAATLRLANSAFYGVPGQVHRVSDALRLVGLRNVASVLVANTLQQQLHPEACDGFSFQPYWQHALVSALAARALALRCDADADAAFLGGLMHTVGQLLLAALMPGPMGQALALARQRDLPCEEAERAVLGLSHRPLGALLLQRWHFPDDVLQAVLAEEAPPADHSDAEARLTRAVHTAGLVARWLLAQSQQGALALSDVLPDDLAERCRLLGLPASEAPALLQQLREAARSLAG
jgi:HD-like signal output (HDOD) protein